MSDDSMDGISKDVPYDLRQIYAVELLGEHLKDVARARKSDNFLLYYKCLKDVWIVVQHKIKDGEKDKVEVVINGEEKLLSKKEYFNYLLKTVADLANANRAEWLGQSHDPDKVATIEQALNNVEIFLYDEIENAKIFGSSKDIPGL